MNNKNVNRIGNPNNPINVKIIRFEFFDRNGLLAPILFALYKTQRCWTKNKFLKYAPLWMGLRGQFYDLLVNIFLFTFKKLIKRNIAKNIIKNSRTNRELFSNITNKLIGDYKKYWDIRQKTLLFLKHNFKSYL